MTMLA